MTTWTYAISARPKRKQPDAARGLLHRQGVTIVLMCCLALLMNPQLVHAAPAFSVASREPTTLAVYPVQVAPAGQPRLLGAGLPPAIDLQLSLACPDNRTEFDLGIASADADGRLATSVTVPLLPPNPCRLLARQDATLLAETTLTILPALELTFSPQAGPPDTTVNFMVRNLAPGSLRLDYAGAAVVGPLPVAAGSYSGSFTVPGDRPDPPGSVTSLRAVNLAGLLLVGQVEQPFASVTGDPPPTYRVTDFRAPLAGLTPGAIFTITGVIDPPPPPTQTTVLPVWKTAAGKLFPVGVGQPLLYGDGGFAAVARVPSLQAGDPFLPQDGDQIGVAVIAPDSQTVNNFAVTDPFLYPGLHVKAVVAGSNPPQTIAGAVVTVSAWPGEVTANAASQQANAVFNGALNQVAGSNSADGELTEEEKLMIQLQMAACPIVGIPVNQGDDLLINSVSPLLEENLGLPSSMAQMLVNTQLTTPGGAVAAADAGATNAGAVLRYLVTVDAIAQGYGVLDDDGLPRTTSFRVDYHTADQTYRTPQGALLPDPVVVALPPLPAWAGSQLGEIKAVFDGLTVDPDPTPGAVPIFSRYYSLAGLPANVTAPTTTSAHLRVVLTAAQKHLLAENGLKLYVDGVYQAPFAIQFNTGVACNIFKGPKVVSKPFYVATATLPNPHLLAPGLRAVRIGATLLADPGKEVSYHYKLRIDGLPATWFAAQNQGTRSVIWSVWGVTFYDGWLTEAGSKQALSSGAKTPQTGPLESDARANMIFTYSAQANGDKGSWRSGQAKGKALNKEGGGVPVWLVAAAQADRALVTPAAAWAVNGVTKQFGPTTETLVPEVTFDLPEAKYGIPFVAEVAAGGSGAYGASVTYAGTITVQDDGAVQSVLSIDPEADTSGTVYVEGRLLSGLIGKAGASLTANFDLHMPVTYDTTKSKPLTAGTYFAYSADFKAWHKWGCVPYVGCAYSDSYTNHLFDGCEQLVGSTDCTMATSAVAAVPTTTQEPPAFDIQLAASSQGALMAIWPASLTSLTTSRYDGYAWSALQTITTGVGASDPQIVFLAPTKALAVWVETTLPAGQPPSFYATIPLTQAVASQRIAYVLWNGSAWSPAAALTTPLYGEGNLALAACVNAPGCPAGGVATLVWQRFVTPDPAQRQFRLYYATFANDAWSAAQPVDPASTTTDILPQVAYRNGAPLVAWVRDSDTDMSDVTSRRVALRTFGDPVFMPVELPNALGEIALAVDGGGQILLAFTHAEDGKRLLDNRRPLWFASGSCTGAACTWTLAQQRDPFGRALYAERPIVTLNTQGQPTLTFRGLGFGPDQVGQRFMMPSDPPGMVFSTGELVQAIPNPTTGVAAPKYLTQDGAVNWMPTAVFHPAAGSTAVMTVKSAAPVENAAIQSAYASPDPSLPVSFALTPDLPDFVVAAVEPVSRFPQNSAALSVTVKLLNQGAVWPGGDLLVTATWDGAPGVGAPAAQTSLRSLDAGGLTTFTLALMPPPGTLELPHTLQVTVNPGQAIGEADATDNGLRVTIGGVPTPTALNASVPAGSELVFLQWTPPSDARIAGYRVYRIAADGAWQRCGSTLVAGWVDPTVTIGATYHYAVAAYTAAGVESALSEEVRVTVNDLPPRPLYLPIIVKR